ncbi:MAG: Gfo/Idh/MocA family oxidoreductase [Oscillospiraceae bacterium]
MDKKQIGIGIVGAGFMCKAHSNAYNTIPYMFFNNDFVPRKVVLGDMTLSGAQLSADRYGYERAAEGWQEVVADKDVDLVDICVGDSLHKTVALEALKNNKHVFCEKPLANDVEDAREMYLAAKQSDRKTMCGFCYRFFPAVRLAKTLVDNGVLGKLYSFNGRYCQDSGAYEDTPADKVWYTMGSKGSGVAFGLGTHIIDMSRYFMGEIGSVNGLRRTYNKTRLTSSGDRVDINADDESLALVEFESGAVADLKISGVAAGRKNQLAFEISGSLGSIYYDIEDPNILHVFTKDTAFKEITGFTKINVTQLDKGHPFMDVWWPRGHAIGWEHSHINQSEHLLAAIADNTSVEPHGATFEDGYKATAVCCSIAIASGSGNKVYMEY